MSIIHLLTWLYCHLLVEQRQLQDLKWCDQVCVKAGLGFWWPFKDADICWLEDTINYQAVSSAWAIQKFDKLQQATYTEFVKWAQCLFFFNTLGSWNNAHCRVLHLLHTCIRGRGLVDLLWIISKRIETLAMFAYFCETNLQLKNWSLVESCLLFLWQMAEPQCIGTDEDDFVQTCLCL